MQSRSDSFLFGSDHNYDRCAASVDCGFRNASHQTLAFKLQQLLGLAKPGRASRGQNDGRDHSDRFLANTIIA
jgi:hypothetical protein